MIYSTNIHSDWMDVNEYLRTAIDILTRSAYKLQTLETILFHKSSDFHVDREHIIKQHSIKSNQTKHDTLSLSEWI